MFTQVDRSLERSQGGLGIGLTLVKRAGRDARRHASRRAATGPGRGSEFVVRLPIAGGRSRRRRAGDGRTARPAEASRRILVADDNLDSAASPGRCCSRSWATRSALAHDGLEAVEVAAGFRPDVVLLDIGMPRQNGYDAARSIRASHGPDRPSSSH